MQSTYLRNSPKVTASAKTSISDTVPIHATRFVPQDIQAVL